MPISPKQLIIACGGATTIAGGSAVSYYLLQDKTIEHRLVSEGIELISTDDEYEVSFKELKETEAFINALKEKTKNIQKSSSLEEGRIALKKWCDASLALDLSEENTKNILPKVKDYCKKLPITVGAKLTSKKRNLVTNWVEKLKKLKASTGNVKNDPDLATALNITNLDSANETEVAQKLQNWCNEKIKTKINKDIDDAIWKQVEKRCVI